MTPGPTRLPARVLAAGARPMIHHRSAEFAAELANLLTLIGPVFGTREAVLPVHATGRGGLEAVISNLFAPGDEIAVCANGRFGELWATIAESYGLIAHRVATNWAEDINPDELDALLSEKPSIRAVTMTYCDTSTAVVNDVEAIARIAHQHDALVLVDGVSAIGGMPFEFDRWGVDAAVTASQKCLMSSPGLAFKSRWSEHAWKLSERCRLPHGYWDLAVTRKNALKQPPQPPGTPPVHVVLQVVEALRMIHEEGLDNVFARHEQMGARMREGAAALGLSLQCPPLRRQSATMTALTVPSKASSSDITCGLPGILVAAGLGPYEVSAFRVGHMGDIRMADVERTLSALSSCLKTIAARPLQ